MQHVLYICLAIKDFTAYLAILQRAFGSPRLQCACAYMQLCKNILLDYPLALVARGDLPNATSPSAQPSGNGLVTFGWTNNAGMGKASDADKAILVVYCPLLNLSVYTAAGDARSTEMSVLNVASFIGQPVETYISFVSADGKDIANSIHTGHFNIS